MIFLNIPNRFFTINKFVKYSPKSVDSLLPSFIRCQSNDVVVTISDVSKKIRPALHGEYVPRKYLLKKPPQETLKNLKWMLQKDILGQDIFLLGGPGSRRRNLALSYLELTGREVEYIALSRDTTEADLKQRREIVDGTAVYFDQSAVRAAKHGRVLLLEGIEKAERNVLPVLNNLLENREMHLEDGRFLVSPERYDKLLKEHSKEEMDSWGLVRVSDDFRVIALGLPFPRYPGHPLDPPLRSRFQARRVAPPTFQEQLEQLKTLAPNADNAKLSQLLSCCHTLISKEAINLGLPDFPLDNLLSASTILETCPNMSVFDIFYRYYPYKLFLGKEGRNAVEDILHTFGILDKRDRNVNNKILSTDREADTTRVSLRRNNDQITINVPSGLERNAGDSSYIETPYQNGLLAEMLLSHASGDFCLVGPKGCGKSIVVQKLAELLGYQVEPVVLYQDMTSRDLIQQRSTLLNGDTIWKDSPLISAALNGKLAVLDGIHRINSSTLAILYRLIHSREIQLHDGKRLMDLERYNEIKLEYKKTDEDMTNSGVLRIHPSFRIIGLAEPPTNLSNQWINAEFLSLFTFHEARPLDKNEEIHIIKSKFGQPSETMLKVVDFAHHLRASEDPTLQHLSGSLSTRQLLRIAEKLSKYPSSDAYDAINRACLIRFLPAIPRQALEDCLKHFKINPQEDRSDDIHCIFDEQTVTIGHTTVNRFKTDSPTKVPDILFYNVPQHLKLLENLLQDFTLGQNILLVGNQGVGKNKIVDRLLQLLNRPREYIQLHRDTTVQTLTLQQMIRDGVVVYEDSPLVQAVKSGHVLVIDEADKAPTHVTCILKTLAESGEMILSDGRRIISHLKDKTVDDSTIIPIHPDFRMIVLANRPGFPFLGNDFFGSLGDLFSTHSVDNPNLKNEISLLKQYGPNVDDKIIQKLVRAFGELRSMSDQGLVSYPYSTREVVNIIKHLQKFPEESLSNVVHNVFDFDHYSNEVFETLVNVLHKHGIPIGTNINNISLSKEFPLPELIVGGYWNILEEKIVVPVQERLVKFKFLSSIKQNKAYLDKTDARSAWFSEMQSYWSVPLKESSFISAIAVENTVINDKIYVLSVDPLCVHIMKLNSDEIRQIYIPNVGNLSGINRPKYSIIPNYNENVWIHEGISNTLMLLNLENESVNIIQSSSMFNVAGDRLSQAFGKSKFINWRINSSLMVSDNQLIFYTPNSNKIEVLDVKNMMLYSMMMPFEINEVILSSVNKWLIQSTSKHLYCLQKTNDSGPCPNVLQSINQNLNDKFNVGLINGADTKQMNKDVLSKALNQKINSPNRLLTTDFSYGTVVIGFPELESHNEVYTWPRKERIKSDTPPVIHEDGYILRALTPDKVSNFTANDVNQSAISHYIEFVDVANHKVQYLPVPSSQVSSSVEWLFPRGLPLFIAATSNQGLVSVDVRGDVRLWEISPRNIERSLIEWKKLVGSEDNNLQITKERYSGLDVSSPKHGKIDPKNEPHVGGNTWAGGTGGRDTAGLGGKGGPYRLDAGHTVHQLSDEEKNSVPEDVKRAAREMGARAFKQRLKDIRMSEYDHKLYSLFSDAVSSQVKSLRIILQSLQAKSKERQWFRHQTSGELDDTKLIEGLTGEKNIYKRRADKEPELGTVQIKPKRLKLVADVSGSMYRFNGYDGRLDRQLEACVMVMEAFVGYENKFQYDIVGHSGDEFKILFVDHNQPPANSKQRLEIIKIMQAHSQFCMSGDHTLEATKHAISTLAKEDTDESIVVVLSDANLERYGIPPEKLGQLLTSSPEVNAFVIFIGSLGDQAARVMQKMPSGRAFVCMDLKNIPRILQQIFTASVLKST